MQNGASKDEHHSANTKNWGAVSAQKQNNCLTRGLQLGTAKSGCCYTTLLPPPEQSSVGRRQQRAQKQDTNVRMWEKPIWASASETQTNTHNICVCIYIYTTTHVYIHVYMYLSTYLCMYICIHMRVICSCKHTTAHLSYPQHSRAQHTLIHYIHRSTTQTTQMKRMTYMPNVPGMRTCTHACIDACMHTIAPSCRYVLHARTPSALECIHCPAHLNKKLSSGTRVGVCLQAVGKGQICQSWEAPNHADENPFILQCHKHHENNILSAKRSQLLV